MPRKSDKLKERVQFEDIKHFKRVAFSHYLTMVDMIKSSKIIVAIETMEQPSVTAILIKLDDTGEYVLYNDSGIINWEDITDDELISHCGQIMDNALVFDTLKEVTIFLSDIDENDYPEWVDHNIGERLYSHMKEMEIV